MLASACCAVAAERNREPQLLHSRSSDALSSVMSAKMNAIRSRIGAAFGVSVTRRRSSPPCTRWPCRLVRVLVEDDRPRALRRDREERVRAGRDGLAGERRVLAEGDLRGRVGARGHILSYGTRFAPDLAVLHAGAAVLDGDVGEADRLGDLRRRARPRQLEVGARGRGRGQREGQESGERRGRQCQTEGMGFAWPAKYEPPRPRARGIRSP